MGIRRHQATAPFAAAIVLLLSMQALAFCAPQASAANPGKGGFTKLATARVLDTRQPGGGGCLGGGVRTVDVGAVAPAVRGQAAVALNVTVVDATEPGWVTVWPGGPRPATSSVNFPMSAAVANLTITGLAPDGTVRIGGSRGCVHVILDLLGSYAAADPAPEPYGLKAIPPARLVDTRLATDPLDPSKPNPHAGCVGSIGRPVLALAPLGTGGLPADPGFPSPGLTTPDALILNVTVVEPDSSGWVSTPPTNDRGERDVSPDQQSSLDFAPHQTRASTIVVRGGRFFTTPGSAWQTSFWVFGGCQHLVIDVVGWTAGALTRGSLSEQASGGMVITQPRRLTDTRTVDPARAHTYRVCGATSSGGRQGDWPLDVFAVVMKIAAVDATAPGWVTVWNGDQPRPSTSSLNFAPGPGAVSNVVIAPVDALGNIAVATSGGCAHLVIDLLGFFSAGAPPG